MNTRSLIACGCVAILFAGFLYAPFFHIHMDMDHDGDHGHAAVLHAHPFELEQESVADELSVEAPHHRHNGTEAGVFIARVARTFAMDVDRQAVELPVERPVLRGCVMEQPQRAHAPPDLRDSNPRSPPA